MLTDDDAREAMGRNLYDSDGDKIGTIAQVYLDDSTGEPEFLTVSTGFFGTHESFVPAREAGVHQDGLRVPFASDVVKNAPHVAADGHLEPADEEELFSYYGMGSAQRETGQRDLSTSETSGQTADDAMTRSEEELRVSTRTQQAGTARLRKYVTTEEQTITVPVTKEYAVLETEPITDEGRDLAVTDDDFGSAEQVVLLHEEVVELTKTVTPVERVRLGTETRVEEQTVTEEVRKERIEVDGDVQDRRP